MKLGIFAFPTDQSLGVVALAEEVEQRGWHSLWLPDHSHIPTARTTPPGGFKTDRPLLEEYKRNIDLFCGLAAAAAVTERILVGSGVCLVAQRDPLWMAKEVATIDHVDKLEALAALGFEWAALLIRPFPATDERRKLDEYQHLVDHFGRLG